MHDLGRLLAIELRIAQRQRRTRPISSRFRLNDGVFHGHTVRPSRVVACHPEAYKKVPMMSDATGRLRVTFTDPEDAEQSVEPRGTGCSPVPRPRRKGLAPTTTGSLISMSVELWTTQCARPR